MTTVESTDVADATNDDEHEHISDWGYVKVALVLAAITSLEVFTYFESVVDWGKALIPALLVMMVLKFAIVTGYFMHLKFDSPVFTRFFVGGLIFAVVWYLVMMLALSQEIWEIFQT